MHHVGCRGGGGCTSASTSTSTASETDTPQRAGFKSPSSLAHKEPDSLPQPDSFFFPSLLQTQGLASHCLYTDPAVLPTSASSPITHCSNLPCTTRCYYILYTRNKTTPTTPRCLAFPLRSSSSSRLLPSRPSSRWLLLRLLRTPRSRRCALTAAPRTSPLVLSRLMLCLDDRRAPAPPAPTHTACSSLDPSTGASTPMSTRRTSTTSSSPKSV